MKTKQKSIIEAVVDFFTPVPKTVTFLKNSCNFSYVGLLHNLELLQFVQLVSAFPLSEIIDRIVASLEVRSAATANSSINPRYTISSVFSGSFNSI